MERQDPRPLVDGREGLGVPGSAAGVKMGQQDGGLETLAEGFATGSNWDRVKGRVGLSDVVESFPPPCSVREGESSQCLMGGDIMFKHRWSGGGFGLRLAGMLVLAFGFLLTGALSDARAQGPNRVVLAMEPPSSETNRFWANGVWHRLGQGLQQLVGNDPLTAEYSAGPLADGLAESWERNVDATEWTFRLKRGVQFHFGYGEMTADDVVHSYKLSSGADSLLSGAAMLRGGEATALDRHTVRFKFTKPQVALLYSLAGRGDLYVYSKTQFDREGAEGYDRRFAGTGHYQYVETSPGRILYRRTPNHYSGHVPDFEELEVRFVGEPATRLAMLLTGEAHIASLPRELQQQAVQRGMKVVASKSAGMQTNLEFGGLYCSSGDPDCDRDLPWADIRVREAMVRALNRKEMSDVLFEGRAGVLAVMGMKLGNEGYDADLLKVAEAKYGYDPARARQLLSEAGYPQRFRNPVIPLVQTAIVGQPELSTQTELVQQYFSAVGLQTEIREIDHAAMRALGSGRKAYVINPIRNSPVRPTEHFLRTYYIPKSSPFFGYESETLKNLIEKLIATQDADGRDQIARQAFHYIVNNYTTMPLFEVYAEAAINPQVVSDWVYPGVTTSGMGHWHLIKAAK